MTAGTIGLQVTNWSFSAIYTLKNDPFTKTGSGQT
jgi:hypothetical protein